MRTLPAIATLFACFAVLTAAAGAPVGAPPAPARTAALARADSLHRARAVAAADSLLTDELAAARREDDPAYELELLVRSAWAGIPLVPLPFDVDYQAPTSRRSHFDPFKDFLRVAGTHGRLLLDGWRTRESRR